MIGKMVPLFHKGNILTKEMLEALKDFAVSISEVSYAGYSDGILSGCSITTTEDRITIHKGIMIFHETAYFITEPVSLLYRPTNEWAVLKAGLQGEIQTDNFISREIEITFAGENQIGEDEIELCRFKLQPGAKLRYRYKDFTDMSTVYDTINEIHAKWSAYGTSSVSPKLLRLFLQEALKNTLTDMQDILLCQQLSNMKGETVSREALSMYICYKTGKSYKLCSNTEIFDGLKEALRQMKGGVAAKPNNVIRDRRMIVD